ncbi:visual pigment-like receptor peropsin [Ptychodera flava]|uniref:visual pigment-like receptor peropsin n=1 Tax=Ptychodera flava TaxID=63121 RepID=UPI00396AA362
MSLDLKESMAETHSKFSDASNVAMGTYLLVAAILAMLGNSFVIEMFRRHRELLSPTTTLLISLAVADLGMAVFAMPFPSLSSFADGWLFEDAGC